MLSGFEVWLGKISVYLDKFKSSPPAAGGCACIEVLTSKQTCAKIITEARERKKKKARCPPKGLWAQAPALWVNSPQGFYFYAHAFCLRKGKPYSQQERLPTRLEG